MAKKIYRCAFYRRVSTEEQAEVMEGSLKNQLQRLNRFMESKKVFSNKDEEWIYVDDYCDEGISAKDENRPQYQRIKTDIENNKINTVLFTDLSRISRNVLHFLELTRFFKENNTDFICINHPEFSTATPYGTILLTIFVALMQFERELGADRAKNGSLDRAERGLWGGGQILGYDLIEKQHGYLKINTEEAKIVRYVFQQYLKVQSSYQVAILCNQRGYKTKSFTSRRKKLCGGNEFTYSTVRQILANPTYIAKKQFTKNGEIKNVKTTCWDPIIDLDTFNETQRLLKANARSNSKNTGKTNKYKFLLGDLIRCNHCDSPLTHSCTRKDGVYHPYYRHRRGHTKEGCPIAGNIPAERLDEVVLSRLSQYLNKTDNSLLLKHEVDKRNKNVPDEIKQVQDDIEEMQGLLRKSRQDHMNILNSLKESPKAIDETTREVMQKLSDDIKSYEAQLNEKKDELKNRQAQNSTDAKVEAILKDKKKGIKNLSTPSQKEIIHSLIARVALNKDTIVLDTQRGVDLAGIIKKREGWTSNPYSYLDVEWVDEDLGV